MKKKLYITSDIHGDFKALSNSLIEAGYNSENEDNLLVVCGDMFDRGSESLEVYKYLKQLSDDGKAVVVRGNHDGIFINYLSGKDISPFNYIYNGTNETLADFLHETAPFETWCMFRDIGEPTNGDFANWVKYARDEINKEYPELLPWLESLPYYYETDKYIFTHGAIDTEVEDWHKPHCVHHNFTDWEALTWNDGTFFGRKIENTDKTVVIGHFHTRQLRKMYNISDGKKQDDILVREDGRVIAIDACTPLSHKVNVLVVEDELV